MILYCDLDVKLLEQLSDKYKTYKWPRPPWSPRCRSPRLWGHGYTGRFFDGFDKALPLKRYRCPDCGAIHTLRPHLYDRRFQVIWFTFFFVGIGSDQDNWLIGMDLWKMGLILGLEGHF